MNISPKTVLGRWKWGGTSALLILSADNDFVAAGAPGEIVKAGPYRHVPCVVDGFDIDIPLIENIPPTTDANEPESTWTARFYDTLGITKRFDWLEAFRLSHITASPVDWADIFTDNMVTGLPASQRALSYEAAVNLIKRGVAFSAAAVGVATIPIGSEVVTVPTTSVEASSTILLTAGPGVQGNLSYENIVPGVSFDIRVQFGDDGPVSWSII